MTDSIAYYNWEGDGCRVYTHPNGDITADIYRSGKGSVSIPPGDILSGGIRISEDAYKKLVLEEIALNKRNENS